MLTHLTQRLRENERCNQWNAKHPRGTRVHYRGDDAVLRGSVTDGEAFLMSGEIAVVRIYGEELAIPLASVQAVEG